MGVLISTTINKDLIKFLAIKSHDLNAFKTGRKTSEINPKRKIKIV